MFNGNVTLNIRLNVMFNHVLYEATLNFVTFALPYGWGMRLPRFMFMRVSGGVRIK